MNRASRASRALPMLLAGATTAGAGSAGLACRSTVDRPAAAAPAPPRPPMPTLSSFDPPAVKPQPAHVELGRLLFFDRRLSGDGTTSCATCHDPAKGFTDGRAKAHGKGGKELRRNTPSVVNIDGRVPMFWDGRAATAEEQALMPVKNPDEMARDLPSLIADLEQTPEYLARFRRAFGDVHITGDRIARAIADYERTVISAGAPFDRYLKGDAAAMTPAAVRGMKLFTGRARCVKCHSGPQLTDAGFHNIGLPGDDLGRFEIVPIAVSKRAFKTPPLRDVALTAPYFHDGSAATLEDVVAHYNRGGTVKDNLDADITPLSLSAGEQQDLVEFMKALTGFVGPQQAPRIPVTPEHPRLRSLREVMKTADKALLQIDPGLPGAPEASDGRAREIQRQVTTLIEAVEQVPPLRPRSVKPEQLADLRERAGDLIVALSDLGDSAGRGDAQHMAAAYEEVRAQCERCHEQFRWPHRPRPR
jgi:cytochrome c peroxidase